MTLFQEHVLKYMHTKYEHFISYGFRVMNTNSRVDVRVGWSGRKNTDGQTDGQKLACLYHAANKAAR